MGIITYEKLQVSQNIHQICGLLEPSAVTVAEPFYLAHLDLLRVSKSRLFLASLVSTLV